MIEKAFRYIEEVEVSITGWLLSFFGILFIRFFFESLSSPSGSGLIPSDPYTLVHYTLFFLSLTLGSALVIGYFTNKYLEAAKVLLFGLPLLWAAPFIDIVLSYGKGFRMLYLFDTGPRLLFDFFTFFGPSLSYGATYGMRIVIATAIISLGYYIYLTTKTKQKAFVGGLCLYVLIFIVGSLPGIFYTLTHISSGSVGNAQVVQFFANIINKSTISHNTLREGVLSVSFGRFVELGFDKLISQILFILSLIFAVLFFRKIYPEKFAAVVKNRRRERLTFYSISLLCGMAFAYINGLGNPITRIDIFGIISMLIGWGALWMHAVHVNDVADIEIDKISNTNRPLIEHTLNIKEMKEISVIWLGIGLLGAWCAGFYPFFMALVYVAASFIYSSLPLRLRRLPLVPSFLISTACLATILAGFFFISVNKSITVFPVMLSIGIIIMVTLAINFKDIKDIEGDRENGILTLPILFGQNGIQVVALLFALSILLVPFFLNFYFLYVIAIPAAVIGYKILMKKPYNEKHVFTLRFFFLGSIGALYLIVYFFSHRI